jgi:hypothetical protein
MRKLSLLLASALLTLPSAPALAADQPMEAAHTALGGIVGVYQKVADAILANNDAEKEVVRAILQVERDLALAHLSHAAAGGAGAAADLRSAAARIGDFATEGGAAIEPIRNRLLQGGHHHHADDTGPQAVYDTGYVVISKKLKVEALDLSKRCAKLAEAGKADAAEINAIRDALNSIATRTLAAK